MKAPAVRILDESRTIKTTSRVSHDILTWQLGHALQINLRLEPSLSVYEVECRHAAYANVSDASQPPGSATSPLGVPAGHRSLDRLVRLRNQPYSLASFSGTFEGGELGRTISKTRPTHKSVVVAVKMLTTGETHLDMALAPAM